MPETTEELMFKSNINKLALYLFLISPITSTFAQTDSLHKDIQSIVDSYYSKEINREKFSGLAVSVSYPKDHGMIKQSFFAGKLKHKKHAKPVTKETLFDTGSITKSYTAAIILQLEAEGYLDINDPIGKWLPQYPRWKDVTIKQLLNMTSGIMDYSNTPEFANFIKKHPTAEITEPFLLSLAHPNEPITPGKKWEYSNSNYILAALIIETITKQNFADVLQARILNPLNLKNTYYAAGRNWKYINKITFPRKAQGYYYDYQNNKLLDLTKINLSWGGPAGAIVSDTADQLKWVDALYHGTIFPEKNRVKLLSELKSIVSMKTGQPINTVDKDDPSGFGLGIGLAYVRDQRFWFYKGTTLSYRMMYVWKPCNNVSVAAGLNSKVDEGDPNSPIGDHIKNLVFDTYQKIIEANPTLMCKD